MSGPVLINGRQEQRVEVSDRAIHYGDGLFETLALVDAGCPWFDRHFARLQEGCERLSIPVPDKQVLLAEVNRLAQGQGRGVIKIIITRGSGGRGYRLPDETTSTRIVSAHAWPAYPAACWQQGVRVHECQTPMACHPRLAGIKHLNRLENVLARMEWGEEDFAEGLMFNLQGELVEGIMSNVFLVKEELLITPDTRKCGVAGIMRDWVIEYAKAHNILFEIRRIGRDELRHADEIILSNSLIGLWPVREYAGRTYPVGQVYRNMIQTLSASYPVRNV